MSHSRTTSTSTSSSSSSSSPLRFKGIIGTAIIGDHLLAMVGLGVKRYYYFADGSGRRNAFAAYRRRGRYPSNRKYTSVVREISRQKETEVARIIPQE